MDPEEVHQQLLRVEKMRPSPSSPALSRKSMMSEEEEEEEEDYEQVAAKGRPEDKEAEGEQKHDHLL